MGKKRITQLLDQLQSNHQAELQNAAAIFTVAQVAVNQLEQQSIEEAIAPLPPATPIDRHELKRRYGSFNACRAAASKQGIRFKKTPTWEQLATAFAYFEAIQSLVHTYLSQHPSTHLHGLSMEFKVE